jgi:hypothetical protein
MDPILRGVSLDKALAFILLLLKTVLLKKNDEILVASTAVMGLKTVAPAFTLDVVSFIQFSRFSVRGHAAY